MTQAGNTIEMIENLVGFDTTSRNSNLELIEFVKGYLEQFGIASELVFDDERRKANLFATIGATGPRWSSPLGAYGCGSC